MATAPGEPNACDGTPQSPGETRSGTRPDARPPARWRGEIPWLYSPAEIRADAVIHSLGIGLAILGSLNFALAMPRIGVMAAVAVSTYLATLVFSMSASAAYNLWPVSGAKWILRRLDHAAIFMLIAGTYTPLMVKIGTWWLLWVVWGVALLGVGLKALKPGRFDRLSIALCLALGWSGIVIADKLLTTLPTTALWLIGAGGLIYSVGVIFHVWERLRFQNAIWHGFVLTAATTHYAAVWSAVAA